MKRVIALVSAAVMLFVYSYIPCAMADASVITISSADELAEFLKSCTSDAFSRGRTFIIENDIDMKDSRLNGGGIFCGTLMGNGHTIKNINMYFRDANGGLFTNIGADGQVRDLNLSGNISQNTNKGEGMSSESIVGDIVKNAGISGISPTESAGMTGAIAAVNAGLIVNCTFEGEISGQSTTGAIAGSNSGTIDTCANGGVISGYERTGGIAGENSGRIKNSRNTGKVNPKAEETTRDTGGIAGYNSGVVEYSNNEGIVGCEGYGTNTGGIAGKQSGCIIECKNSGSVGAKKNAGGITGIFIPFTEVDVIADDLKGEIEKRKQELKDESQRLHDNLKKSVDDLTNGVGLFNGALPKLGGSSDGLNNVLNSLSGYIDSASERRDRAADSMDKAADSVSDNLNSLTDLAGAIENAINEHSENRELENELQNAISEISSSLAGVNESMGNALDKTAELSGNVADMNDEMTRFLNTLSGNMNASAINREQLTDSLTSALDRMDFDTGALDDASRALLNLSYTLDDIVEELSDTNDDIQSVILDPFRELNRTVKRIIRDIENNKITANNVKETIKKLKEDINKVIEQLRGKIEENLKRTPAPKIGMLDRLFTTAYAEEDDSRLSLDDILDTERIKEEMKKAISVDVTLDRSIAGEYSDTALIKNCINTGEIRCSENSGGIAGNMGVESLRRKGEVIQLPDGKTVVSDMAVKAVINACINNGRIYAKERFAGGITGASNVGIIKNCLGAGEVCAENNGYAGGIGGDMNASILYSIGAARVSGKNDLGGIAGAGNVIRECYSIAEFDGDAERIGMLAGSTDGSVENNCFISEGIGGIGGASYETNAEEIPFEEMKCTDKLPVRMDMFFNDDWVSEKDCFPQIKALALNDALVIGLDIKALSAKYARTVFTVNFIIDNEIVKSVTKNYNETLAPDEIPTLTGADGRYPHWNRDTTLPIRRHTDFIAEYNDATMTIASDEEPPILLVEGNFSDSTSVTVNTAEITADFAGYTKLNAYSFKIEPEKDSRGGFRMHVLSRDKNACAIGIVKDGEPEVIECERDGSYLVCDMQSPQSFVILAKESTAVPTMIIIVCIAGVMVLVAGGIFVKRKNKYRNSI